MTIYTETMGLNLTTAHVPTKSLKFHSGWVGVAIKDGVIENFLTIKLYNNSNLKKTSAYIWIDERSGIGIASGYGEWNGIGIDRSLMAIDQAIKHAGINLGSSVMAKGIEQSVVSIGIQLGLTSVIAIYMVG